MMNEIIKINYDNDRPTVTGRELHEFLGVDSNYTTWFDRMCGYGFSDGADFIPFLEESTGGRPSVNHQLTVEMAKEVSMLQRNEKGKQARQYFIQLEKAWNTPEQVMARALKLANQQIEEVKQRSFMLEQTIKEQQPQVIFANAVSVSKTSILVGELAKILNQNGVDIGQNRLFEWLRNDGYLIKRKGTDYNMPTQRSMELGLFEIKETSIAHSDGHTSISKTPKVTGKGQIYFVNKYRVKAS